MNEINDYQYNIFLSYCRNGAAEIWVREFFEPKLKLWLPEVLPPGSLPRIFLDKDIPTGSNWPQNLRDAIKCSRILLPVLNSQYFASKWCLAELDSMLAREKLLKRKKEIKETDSLIYPVVFCDGVYFRADIKKMQLKDMKKYACTISAYTKSENFVEFEQAVKEISEEISEILNKTPPFDPSWPIVVPEPNIPEVPKNDQKIPMDPPRINKMKIYNDAR